MKDVRADITFSTPRERKFHSMFQDEKTFEVEELYSEVYFDGHYIGYMRMATNGPYRGQWFGYLSNNVLLAHTDRFTSIADCARHVAISHTEQFIMNLKLSIGKMKKKPVDQRFKFHNQRERCQQMLDLWETACETIEGGTPREEK